MQQVCAFVRYVLPGFRDRETPGWHSSDRILGWREGQCREQAGKHRADGRVCCQSLHLTNCTSKNISFSESCWWRRGERRKRLFNGAGSSIHHAETSSTMHTKLANTGHAGLLNLVEGVRRAPEPAASHRASKASSSQLKKAPVNEKLHQESRSHQGHTEASDPLSCTLKTSGDRPTDKGKVTGHQDPLQHTVQLSWKKEEKSLLLFD